MGFKRDVAELATTNARTAVGLLEAVAYVATNLTLLCLNRPINAELDLLIGTFILIQQGLDVTQFGIKRWTFDPEAHKTPVKEDTIPKPIETKVSGAG